jgi:hypothetical protein
LIIRAEQRESGGADDGRIEGVARDGDQLDSRFGVACSRRGEREPVVR